jgi:DNA-binding transcriptional LysR family regulator
MVQQFLAVAETRSFRKAAERMHMAQPPLSQAIIRLEGLLGATLFLRTSLGVRMTPAGEVFQTEARRLIHQAEAAVERTRNAASGETGTVRLGFIAPALFGLLRQMLPAFRQRYPGIQLTLTEGTSPEVTRMVEDEAVDIGLLITNAEPAPGIVVEDLMYDPLVAVLPARHPLADAGDLALIELADEPFVLLSPQGVPTVGSKVVELCLQAGFVPQVAQEATQIATLIGLVAGGLGVSIVPWAMRSLAPSEVVFLPLRDQGPDGRVTISAAFRSDSISGPGLNFLSVVRDFARTNDVVHRSGQVMKTDAQP